MPFGSLQNPHKCKWADVTASVGGRIILFVWITTLAAFKFLGALAGDRSAGNDSGTSPLREREGRVVS